MRKTLNEIRTKSWITKPKNYIRREVFNLQSSWRKSISVSCTSWLAIVQVEWQICIYITPTPSQIVSRSNIKAFEVLCCPLPNRRNPQYNLIYKNSTPEKITTEIGDMAILCRAYDMNDIFILHKKWSFP